MKLVYTRRSTSASSACTRSTRGSTGAWRADEKYWRGRWNYHPFGRYGTRCGVG